MEGHAVQGPGGWMHAACAPKSTPAWVVPLAIVGCAVPAGFALLFGMYLAIWQFLSPEKPPAAATAADAGVTEALTQRYEMGNGMLAVHYPASFAASRQGDTAVIVTRALSDGNAETLVFEAVAEPISTDIQGDRPRPHRRRDEAARGLRRALQAARHLQRPAWARGESDRSR